MNLDDIPAGSLCVIDSNILIYAEQGYSLQTQRILRRIEERELSGLLPEPVWQETIHRLMMIEAIQKGQVRGANPGRQLAANPDAVKDLTLYREKARALITLGLRFEACLEDDALVRSPELQQQYGLLAKDSLILAMALRLGADFLISTTGRFTGIQGIGVASPSDVVLGSSP